MEQRNAILCTLAGEPTACGPEATPARAGTGKTTQSLGEAIQKAAQKAREEAEKAADKKMGGVFKSMLLQQGLDAQTAIQLTAEWVAEQQTARQHTADQAHCIAQLEQELQAIRQAQLAAQKRNFFERRLEEEGLHPHAARLLARFANFEEMELANGRLEGYEAFIEPVRRECPGLFGTFGNGLNQFCGTK